MALLFTLGSTVATTSADAKVPPKLIQGLASNSVKVRIIAVAAIAKTGDPTASPLLRAMLEDQAPTVRAAAVDGLVTLKDAGALALVEAMAGDPDKAVQAVVGRAIKALNGMVLFIDSGDVADISGRNFPNVATRLQAGFEAELRKILPADVVVQRGNVTKGYGALLKVRSAKNGADAAGNGYLEITCDMTLVELPGKILRLSSKASAAAGVEGKLPPGMEAELANDGIDACAPSLAKDFADYVEQRRPR